MLSALHNLIQVIADLVDGLFAVNLQVGCALSRQLSRKTENLQKKITHILAVSSVMKNTIKDRTKIQKIAHWLRKEINKSRRNI